MEVGMEKNCTDSYGENLVQIHTGVCFMLTPKVVYIVNERGDLVKERSGAVVCGFH